MKKKPVASARVEPEIGLPEDQIRQAVDTIRRGGIVAFPTETYYGLAVDPFNERALRNLYILKRRAPEKPVLLLISDLGQLNDLVESVPAPYEGLISRYWPGPLTLIFPAAERVPTQVTAGSSTVGIRLTPHPLAVQLVRRYGRALTATSANLSGEEPAQTPEEVKRQLGDGIDWLLDGGRTAGGACSTIVGLKGDQLCLIRPGQVRVREIAG